MSTPSQISAFREAEVPAKTELLAALRALARGDFNARLSESAEGIDGEIAAAFNSIAQSSQGFQSELDQVARGISQRGDLSIRVRADSCSAPCNQFLPPLNAVIDLMAHYLGELTQAMSAISKGQFEEADLRPICASGDFLKSTQTTLSAFEQLRSVALSIKQLTRSRALDRFQDRPASIRPLEGDWRDVVENVNSLVLRMAAQVGTLSEIAHAVTHGNFARAIEVHDQSDLGELKDTVGEMVLHLRDATLKSIEQDWLKTNLAKFNRLLHGQRDLQAVLTQVFSELAPVVSAQHALFYLAEQGTEVAELKLSARRSKTPENPEFPLVFRMGEGAVGRCAATKQRILLAQPLTQCSPGQQPVTTILVPIVYENQTRAVMVLVSREGFSDSDQVLLQELSESLGIVLHSIDVDARTQSLLKQSQALAQELQQQQQKLRKTNEDLAEKANLLTSQKSEMEKKNREVEQARQALREKATQVAQNSRYKSEFLANMSHELRTPLNAMLLLARQLAENQEETMTERQVEFARVIHSAGNELLRLINDILDLSKIESGTVTVDVSELQFWELQEFVERNFRVLARSKNLDFSIELAPLLPAAILTDCRRLEQVLKNLLANAFKFTEKGGVHVRIRPASSGWNPENTALSRAETVISFSVSDSGIGISEDKKETIFEAFQQGDGGTGRKFGGTGLGLTISREIARLLGGEIQLSSLPNVGSVFTLYLPVKYVGSQPPGRRERTAPVQVLLRGTSAQVDDRDSIQEGDRILLSVEDDQDFAGCLRDTARESGFRVLYTAHGSEALELVQRYKPNAITLDVTLPDVDGWKIIEQLKDDPATRHIPISIISVDEDRRRAMALGASSHLLKPVPVSGLKPAFTHLQSILEHKNNKVLIIQQNSAALMESLNGSVNAIIARGGQAALSLLKQHNFDCIVMDMDLLDMTGFHLLGEIKKLRGRNLPIVARFNGPLALKDQHHLHRLEQKLFLKPVFSFERMLDMATLFLNISVAKLPEKGRQIIQRLHRGSDILEGKRVLIVDDDIRNVFALTSVIERHNMRVISADNGQAALTLLESPELVDIVLMDIMMPGMDGYQTTERLRQIKGRETVPVIAVTAKAMKEDRAKCLQAGASHYIPKPVDTQQLLAALRLWLFR